MYLNVSRIKIVKDFIAANLEKKQVEHLNGTTI
jgi:hypothetical protein